MRSTQVLIAALGIALLSGCGHQASHSTSQDNAAATGTAEAPPSGEGHAAADVVPGSYEDWCAEHEVPESQCTRCNPSLIPAFQAVNDWDAEHGLPMSQCKIHDPNLKIVRPAKPEGK